MGFGHGRGRFVRGARSLRSARMRSQKSKSEKQSYKKDDGTVTCTEEEYSLEYPDKDMGFFEVLATIVLNTEFVLLMLASTGIFFVVAGVQYWSPNYIE